ncbi:winged helix-turn-helix domain-containing protein [Saccharibacillus kuerlensis]|uniref:OmpR/PhoB-type domain-containing protein n=1 Tax=Saccharibacillus kuerlensis TaxID=459527 RepID=A0ABQ2KUR1_9BACL|nr:winged helix-turn-helix domain-containing protein [Saccharibacillus kuerlensis]GGN93792.1 hypothetical protein GCM10010969_07890 [Saccharibacillus kuerlensis]
MSGLTFDDGRLTVESAVGQIGLLAKEYALLHFLYLNANIVFSRDQLLERVWTGEYPVDRTVDDHVYRLRKKLKTIGGPTIETIRGVGYALSLRPSASDGREPSLRDPAVQEAMSGVFARYHRLGQGRAMLALAGQRETLGFELDSFYRLYLHFIAGDLRWFLETNEAPIGERIYWLLLFDMFVTDTPWSKAGLCERALRLKALPADGHREMELLNIADLYAAEGRTAEALETLEKGRQAAAEQKLDGFVIPIEISELYVRLMEDGPEASEMQSLRAAKLLEAEPYMRELAGYRMLEGTRLLLAGSISAGEALLGEGLDTFERSGFVPHRLLALLRICDVLRRHMPGSSAERKYSAKLATEYNRLGIAGLEHRLRETIEGYLDNLERT